MPRHAICALTSIIWQSLHQSSATNASNLLQDADCVILHLFVCPVKMDTIWNQLTTNAISVKAIFLAVFTVKTSPAALSVSQAIIWPRVLLVICVSLSWKDVNIAKTCQLVSNAEQEIIWTQQTTSVINVQNKGVKSVWKETPINVPVVIQNTIFSRMCVNLVVI